ncbi:MAG: hypothetical protein KGL39_53935 [Patescibacteria group bacterium]|nr:hypothetical protein [Patescibacteria group bacterium]
MNWGSSAKQQARAWVSRFSGCRYWSKGLRTGGPVGFHPTLDLIGWYPVPPWSRIVISIGNHQSNRLVDFGQKWQQ